IRPNPLLNNVSTQHVAGFRLGDVALFVLLDQEAFASQLPRGVAHRFDVSAVVAVALLERWPRVAIGQPLGPGVGKGDEGAAQAAGMRSSEALRTVVPSRVGSQRNADFHLPHTGSVEPVRISPGNEHRVPRTERGNAGAQPTAKGAKVRTETEQLQLVHKLGELDAGDGRINRPLLI